MAKKTGSALFPYKQDGITKSIARSENSKQLIESCMGLFLITSPGQRRGNPTGSILPSLKHQLIPSDKLKEYEQIIKEELLREFAAVTINSVTLTRQEDQTTIKLLVDYFTPTLDLQTFEFSL